VALGVEGKKVSVCVDSFGWVTGSVSGIKEWRVKWGLCVSTPLDG
jgi:hypothetical protein